MHDVFLSYSRRDTPYVGAVADGLAARGKTPWLDTEGIQDGEVFPAVLREAIEAADGFVFVISPDAVVSPFCAQEVEHALALGKRIVPVLHRTVPDALVPPGIRERQWVPGGEQLDASTLDRLVLALDADPDHTRRHTLIGLRAKAWDDQGRRAAEVPRSEELEEAAGWLVGAQGRDPSPTPLQAEWIAAGRAAMLCA